VLERINFERIKKVLIKVVMGGVLLLIQSGISAWGMPQGNPAAGKKTFLSFCVQCHGVNGDGKGLAAAALMEKPANFTDPALWKMGDDAFFIHIIRRGRKIMPAFWDVLKPQEIRDVLAYEKTFPNRTIQKETSSKGNPVRGKRVFLAFCVQCHGVNGDGKGLAAAALMEKPANFTDPALWKMGDDDFFIHVIRRGRKIMPAFWDVLKPREIRDVLAYEKTFLKK